MRSTITKSPHDYHSPNQRIPHTSTSQVFKPSYRSSNLPVSLPISPHLFCSYHLLPLLLLFFTLAVEIKEGIAILVMPTEAVLFKSRRNLKVNERLSKKME
jgi:hypothetical protein